MRQVTLLAAVAATLPFAALAEGNAENGKRLFLRDGCYECHGYAAQGGRDGARISRIGLDAKAMILYVRKPAGAMPAFSEKVITDQELTDIHAYLQTLPAPKAAKDIPLLNQLRK